MRSNRPRDTESHGHSHRFPSLTNTDDCAPLAIGRQSDLFAAHRGVGGLHPPAGMVRISLLRRITCGAFFSESRGCVAFSFVPSRSAL